VFTKLRPFEDYWGNYKYHLQVVAPKDSLDSGMGGIGNAKVGIAANNSPVKNNTVSIGPIMMDSNTGGHFDEMMEADNMGGIKECPQCTYHNLPILSFCEICGQSL